MAMTSPSDSSKKGDLFQWSAVAMAIVAMVYFAALYEPIRLILIHGGPNVMNAGGVGGVGGLANLKGPVDNDTGTCGESGSGNQNFKGNYCYEPGWKNTPLTPFAWITLAFWVGPFLLACLFLQLNLGSNKHAPSETATTETQMTVSNPAEPLPGNVSRPAKPVQLAWLTTVWVGLNLIWFLVPLAQFGFGLREITGGFSRTILAIGLAAAHPLSWNAALVIIPTGGIVTRLILPHEKLSSNTKDYWFGWHRLLGYSTISWAVLHGGCELLYIASKRNLRRSFDVFHDGEAVLYLLGLTLLILFIAHAFLAYFRKRFATSPPPNQGITFRGLHTTLAVLILVVAACHWWPFALFFVPATAIQGVSWGETMFAGKRRGYLSAEDLSRRQTGGLLGTSILASLVLGFMLAWKWRQDYMMSSSANLYIPFVFPLLSVVMSLLASTMLTVLFLALFNRFADGGRRTVGNQYQEIPEHEAARTVDNHDEATFLLENSEI